MMEDPVTTEEKLLTRGEAAKYMGRSLSAIRGLVDRGTLVPDEKRGPSETEYFKEETLDRVPSSPASRSRTAASTEPPRTATKRSRTPSAAQWKRLVKRIAKLEEEVKELKGRKATPAQTSSEQPSADDEFEAETRAALEDALSPQEVRAALLQGQRLEQAFANVREEEELKERNLLEESGRLERLGGEDAEDDNDGSSRAFMDRATTRMVREWKASQGISTPASDQQPTPMIIAEEKAKTERRVIYEAKKAKPEP